MGFHSTMERFAGASYWSEGWRGGVRRGGGCQFVTTWGFPNPGFRNLQTSRGKKTVASEPRVQQTRVYPYPLVTGSARANPKVGAPDPENPLFLGFSVLRGDRDHGLGRGQTMG